MDIDRKIVCVFLRSGYCFSIEFMNKLEYNNIIAN